jgi:outer membrane protein OmpA-like peptidoglycan-associated protein
MKNINTIKATLCIAGATLLGLSLCGCGVTAIKDSEYPANVAVVNASNSNSVCLDMAEIQPAIADACKSNGYFSYIIADGEPFIGYHDSIFIDGKNLSTGNYNRRINSKATEVSESIATWTPQTDEVDLLKALNLAAKDMAGKESPTIIVFTNGLSTVGKLDMTELSSLDRLDVAATVEDLKTSYAIPDFSGCSVLFYMAKAAGNQEALTDKEERIIAELWQCIIETGGGSFSMNYYLPDSVSVLESAPNVTPVAIGDDGSSIREITLENVPETLPADFEVTIGEEDIAFKAGTAEIKDEAAAREKISSFADTVESNHIDLLLVASTASYGEADSSVTLSEERGRAIERLLREAGVTTDIRIKGFGYDPANPFFSEDLENGQLVESIAATNRKVVIIALDSEQATNILN